MWVFGGFCLHGDSQGKADPVNGIHEVGGSIPPGSTKFPQESSHVAPDDFEPANRHGLAMLVAEASDIDGVHLDPPQQRKLALAVKEVVEPLL